MTTSSPHANTNPSHLLRSCACSQSALESRELQDWVERVVKGTWPEHEGDSLWMHRKVWEWCYICQALYERELLKPDIRGLGFAVGKEPLSAIFASHGCNIVATDLDTEKIGNDSEWIETNQHAANLKDLNKAQLCSDDTFKQRVSFRFADMNHIDDDLTGFDFMWSSCSMEHLGSLQHGKEFVYNSLKCLKPGGFAVHTTEFNVSSNKDTLEDKNIVIYRKKDLEEIARTLQAAGHRIELDFTMGNKPYDLHVDTPPYKHDVHLRLEIGGYVCTSFGLIIQKAL